MKAHASIQTAEKYLGMQQSLVDAANDKLGIVDADEWRPARNGQGRDISFMPGRSTVDNIAELEDTLRMLAEDRKRIAVFYEKGKGWCVTDDTDVLPPKISESAPEYRIICYKDWFRRAVLETLKPALAERAKMKGSVRRPTRAYFPGKNT